MVLAHICRDGRRSGWGHADRSPARNGGGRHTPSTCASPGSLCSRDSSRTRTAGSGCSGGSAECGKGTRCAGCWSAAREAAAVSGHRVRSSRCGRTTRGAGWATWRCHGRRGAVRGSVALEPDLRLDADTGVLDDVASWYRRSCTGLPPGRTCARRAHAADRRANQFRCGAGHS